MNKLIITIGALLIGQILFAQNEDDALRYSQTFFGGTARSTGSAGAMTAIGGDFSVVAQNPAGLARIRKTNFSATFNVENANAATDFNGANSNKNATFANFANLSYVKAYKLDPKKYNNWYSVQLGMGITRLKSFNEKIEYNGKTTGSILNSFANEASGTSPNDLFNIFPFSASLAYEAFAIDPVDSSNQFVPAFSGDDIRQNRIITREGGMNEYTFSVSGNYANKLYLGGAVNFTKVNFDESFRHKETYADTASFLKSTEFSGRLGIDGWGTSVRLGLIYLPVEWLSIGLSGQSPTRYKLSDSWSNNMSSRSEGDVFNVPDDLVPTGAFDYTVTTPFKANASLGIVLEKFGSIGVEVEYVDYSGASLKSNRFSDSPYGFTDENFQIENIYQSTLNYKFGAEARINPQFYLRGGLAIYGSPYKAGKGNSQNPTLFYTGGLGYNWGTVYLDGAVVIKETKEDYYAYDPTLLGSKATINHTNVQFKFSLGLRMK